MNFIKLTLATLIVSNLSITSAKANNQAHDLIYSCTEAVNIYEKKDKKNLYAGVTTSVSEALRAGYCRGVLVEYRRSNRLNCHQGHWLEQARIIAEQPIKKKQYLSVESLLRKSCD